ncbi:MAG TPA: DUF3221 domain-containing protein [Bacillaceae bacterium]|nr:DUF3221 domain-containing protein [Bacillaceae bacterium]
MRSSRVILLLILLKILISACSLNDKHSADVPGSKITGYILIVESSKVLLVEDATLTEYSEWKDLTLSELIALEPTPKLIYLFYSDTGNLKAGDQVTAILSGGIDQSLPAKAGAETIEKIK